MTNSTVDRFQLLHETQLEYPNKCAVCGSFTSDDGKRFISFGCWIELFGTVYICTNCFVNAANVLLDTTPSKQYEEALLQIEELRTVVKSLNLENGVLRASVDNLRTLDRPHPSSLIEHDSREQEERAEPSNPVTEEPDPNTTGGEEGSPEQTDERGPSDVQDDDRDEPSIGLSVFNI